MEGEFMPEVDTTNTHLVAEVTQGNHLVYVEIDASPFCGIRAQCHPHCVRSTLTNSVRKVLRLALLRDFNFVFA